MAPYYAYNQALLLKFMNRAVAITKQPIHRQTSSWKGWEDSLKVPNPSWQRTSGLFAYLFLPALPSMTQAELSYESKLQSARVMIASERYRRKHGIWPDAISTLVPDFLEAEPVDPYDGHPLRLIRVPDGLVIYSVGPNLADDLGNLDEKFLPKTPGTDFGYRLWDVDARRRPAPEMPLELPGDVFESDGP
jgi:hypothetical protein